MISISYTEAIAAFTGLIGVWLTTKQIIWCWPVALVSIVTSLIVFLHEKLYQDALLQVFYLVLTLYGWYNWLYGGNSKKDLPISNLPYKKFIWYVVAMVVGVNISSWYFLHYTDAAMPFWDSISLVGGIIGTLWMAKKWLQHWLLWIIIDIICTGIYFYKDLYFFAAQFIIFTLLAIYGFYQWKKEYKLLNA